GPHGHDQEERDRALVLACELQSPRDGPRRKLVALLELITAPHEHPGAMTTTTEHGTSIRAPRVPRRAEYQAKSALLGYAIWGSVTMFSRLGPGVASARAIASPSVDGSFTISPCPPSAVMTSS